MDLRRFCTEIGLPFGAVRIVEKMNEEISEVCYQLSVNCFLQTERKFSGRSHLLPDTDRDFFIITADLHVKHMRSIREQESETGCFLTPSPILLSGARYVSEDMGNTGFRNMNGCGVMWK